MTERERERERDACTLSGGRDSGRALAEMGSECLIIYGIIRILQRDDESLRGGGRVGGGSVLS